MLNSKDALTVTLLLSISLIVLPKAYGSEMHEHNQQGKGEAWHGVEAESTHGEGAGICPVLHKEASEEYPYTYEGKTYYFYCPMCIEEFKKDPDKYISRIKEINLEAFQFGFSPDKITVKKGDIVKLYATSRDVVHGLYIKDYDINVRLKKGETKKIEFVADKTGEFDILCSIYCGRGHHNMKAELIVEK